MMDPTLKNTILKRLQRDIGNMSPALQTVAKYLIDNPADFGLDPIRTTAEKSGVSTYSLVRLADQLGFDSYDDLRAPFRVALVSGTDGIEKPRWIEDLRSTGETGQQQADSALNALAAVQQSLAGLPTAKLEKVVDTLLAADTVYITAMRASFSMAYYFQYVGSMVLPSLQLIPRNMNSAVDELNNAHAGDVLIAVTIMPYSRETIDACEFAQAKGVKLILISDSEVVSPDLHPEAVLVAQTRSTHHFASFTGITAILETLLALLLERGGKAAQERVRSYEDLRARHNAYWVAPKNS